MNTTPLLRFRPVIRKKRQTMIMVYRICRNEQDKIFEEKYVGSFSEKRDYKRILSELSSEGERYEFENFVAILDFNKATFHMTAEAGDRFIIKAAPEFTQALFTLWETSQQFGLDFTPEYEMLVGIFNEAKIVEQRLALLTNGECSPLQALGVDVTKLNHPKPSLKAEAQLFQVLIQQSESKTTLAEEFNALAQKYGKKAKFEAHHFDYYVQQIEQGEKQPFPKWYYTIAIELLFEKKVNPDTILPPALLTEHWLRLHKKATLEETQKAFANQFKHLAKNALCLNVMKVDFFNEALAQMQCAHTHSPIPSLAVGSWLKRWKTKNPEGTLKSVRKDFGKEFPILKDNSFLLSILDKNFS